MAQTTPPPALEAVYAELERTRDYGRRELRRRTGLAAILLGLVGLVPGLAVVVGLFLNIGETPGTFGWILFLLAATFVGGLPAVTLTRVLRSWFDYVDLPPPPPQRGLVALIIVSVLIVLASAWLTVYRLDAAPLGVAVLVALVAGQVVLFDGARARRKARIYVGAFSIALGVAMALLAGFFSGAAAALLVALGPLIVGALWIGGGTVFTLAQRTGGAA